MIQAIYIRFFNKFFPLLAPLAGDANVSPFFVLSVAALETGFGKYVSHNNFFGVKASLPLPTPSALMKISLSRASTSAALSAINIPSASASLIQKSATSFNQIPTAAMPLIPIILKNLNPSILYFYQ